MSYETAQNPSSLVRPLIVNPHGVGKQKKGIFRPPFPEIDLRNWQGFCFSPLRWVATKKSDFENKEGDFGDPDTAIAFIHEMCPWKLESSPFILLKQNEMFKFYDLILKSFEDGQHIHVPLILNKPGNQLREQWEILVSLNRGSELVEEVYAVQTSLLKARREGYISLSELKLKIEQYQEAYTEIIPAFAAGFEGINFFASFIGEDAVNALIHSSLETADPDKALLDTMFELTKSDSGDFEHFELLCNLVYDHKNDDPKHAQDFLRNFTNRLDPDDSLYQRRALLGIDFRKIDKEAHSFMIKYLEDDFSELLFGDVTALLASEYIADNNYMRITSLEIATEYNKELISKAVRGYFILILEAIRQQLTTGRGLLCPMWMSSAPRCCSSRYREFLEKVWSCTYRNSDCKLWKRMGCLQGQRGIH